MNAIHDLPRDIPDPRSTTPAVTPSLESRLGADLLVCSAYKFFGPHQGVLWGRQALLDQLPAYKVRPASGKSPGKFETGTQSHEGQAGVLGAVDYFEWLGVHEGATVAWQLPTWIETVVLMAALALVFATTYTSPICR